MEIARLIPVMPVGGYARMGVSKQCRMNRTGESLCMASTI